jgi:formate dehydrogenase beta subunit
VTLDYAQEFLVQPVDASWLQCNIECQEACPVGTNCRGYLNLAAEGRFEEGYILAREPNPVAAMCSYVCSAPCERACRRGDIDRPLAIRAMKRFLVEWHEASGIPDVMPAITPRAERVAVVGAGPAGLAVSRELATRGYQVTVYDSLPYGGGTMLIGVPAFRLPREAIEMDVRLVERLGVTFQFDTTIGSDIPFSDLQRDFDAIAITAGAMNPVYLDLPGADLEGVQYGIDFMKKANLGQELSVGRHVVVIGGGYTAMDCSRTSLRHGAEHVTIAYRRTRSELVVDEEELGETEREGVALDFLVSPIELIGEDGRLTGVRFIRNRLGEPDASGRRSPVPIEGSEFVVPADTVIPAVSQAADLSFLPVEASFEVNRGRLKVDPATYATNIRGVFACGDFVTGPTTLIESAGHGKKAAYAIDRYLDGRTDVTVTPSVKITSSWRHEMPEFYDVLPRQHIPMVDLPARFSPSSDPQVQKVNFSTPVELGYDATAAVAESTRCLMCNYNIWFDPFRCVLCGACADVCPEGVIHMVDVNQLKTEGLLPEIEEAYGWSQGAAMILDEERCIRCALCVKRCPFDAITMERFELQEISSDGRLYKESYRDAQLAGTAGVAGGAR